MKKIYFSILALLCFLSVSATHIVGGTITYESLGNDEYKIRLELYRDCDDGNPQAPFDDPAYVAIFDIAGVLTANVSIDFSGISDTITYGLPIGCWNIANTCVEKTVYEGTIELPATAGGYTIAYQRCCRQIEIDNLIHPVETGMTLHTHIATEFQNAGPGFNKDIPCMAFVGVPFSFDASATDADGDSLVYELKTPFTGGSLANPQPIPASPPPFEIVSYILPQFSEGNMLGGNSSFTIDPETGEMTAIPVFEGEFQTGYLVKEFKGGQHFGTTYKEFVVDVTFPVSNQNIEESDKVQVDVYPNPVSDGLFFQLDVKNSALFSVNIYNMYGQRLAAVLNNELIGKGLYTKSIDLEPFSVGVYFLEVEMEGGKVVKKIIKN
jgi:hypothetical protein